MSRLTPFRASSNATIESFIVPETAEHTLMRSTILSGAPHRKSRHKPAPPLGWRLNRPLSSSKIRTRKPNGSTVTPPTASITVNLPPANSTPHSGGSSSPLSTLSRNNNNPYSPEHTVIRIVQCFQKPEKSLIRAIFLFFLAYMQKKA